MPTPIRGCASTAEQRIALIDPKTATFGVGSRTSHVLSPNKGGIFRAENYLLGLEHVFPANIAACPRSSH
jgi:hypothetical protein